MCQQGNYIKKSFKKRVKDIVTATYNKKNSDRVILQRKPNNIYIQWTLHEVLLVEKKRSRMKVWKSADYIQQEISENEILTLNY